MIVRPGSSFTGYSLIDSHESIEEPGKIEYGDSNIDFCASALKAPVVAFGLDDLNTDEYYLQWLFLKKTGLKRNILLFFSNNTISDSFSGSVIPVFVRHNSIPEFKLRHYL